MTFLIYSQDKDVTSPEGYVYGLLEQPEMELLATVTFRFGCNHVGRMAMGDVYESKLIPYCDVGK